ncbi:MAG: HNH endonuclease [candidate division Zixibacteria bacterium]|nr:HNH endonuclease [candidate division Zixibacteria bacterium]
MLKTITARHFDLSDEMRAKAEDEMEGLKRYFDNIISAELILATEKHIKKAELKVRVYNQTLAAKADTDDFYSSKEWRSLRYRVLRKYSAECMCCGRSKKNDGVVIHVDHIKPRSKYPYLALDFKNLQLLCEDCNLGKSNIDETDWRPALDEKEQIDAALDMEQLQRMDSY